MAKTPLGPLLPLYLVIHAGYIGYGMMVTLFVQLLLVKNNGLVPPEATTAYRTTVTGILLALYPIGQFFGTPVLSALSDRFGRKRVLLPSLAATTCCYVLVALSLQLPSLLLLGASLVLCGLGEANVAIAQSAIADVSPPEDRGRLFGYVYVAVRLGYVVGPLIGGQVVERTGNYALPFWIAAALLSGALAWTKARFQETHPPEAAGQVDYLKAFTSLTTLFTDPPLRTLYAVNFLLYVAIFGFSRTILIYLVDAWHMGPGDITLFYAYFAAAVMVANLWIMPVVQPHVSQHHLAIGTAVVGGLATVAIALARSEFWLWVWIGPASCLLSLCLSASAAILANAVSPGKEGQVMGNNEALQVAGQAAGAAGGGALAALQTRLPLYLSGAMVLLGALMLATRSRTPTAPTAQKR